MSYKKVPQVRQKQLEKAPKINVWWFVPWLMSRHITRSMGWVGDSGSWVFGVDVVIGFLRVPGCPRGNRGWNPGEPWGFRLGRLGNLGRLGKIGEPPPLGPPLNNPKMLILLMKEILYCRWLKSGVHQLRLVIEITLFTGFLTGGAGFQPSTVISNIPFLKIRFHA